MSTFRNTCTHIDMSLYCFNAENVSKEFEISEVEESYFFLNLLICPFSKYNGGGEQREW